MERGSNGGIYFGTDVGVFYTNVDYQNDGTGWVLFGPDLPHISIRDLDINYVANKIRASLPGRGVWEHDLYCPCLLYTSDAADERSSVDLGGRRIIKKKHKTKKNKKRCAYDKHAKK